ncbi:response regulator transcription factor [Streptomyces sp. NBC_01803]|uniref:response regulator transcription factor n=1 Tax=Streptomyces sp. NBC_01803 TaxID=2975946 RepID=UPI003FA39FFB
MIPAPPCRRPSCPHVRLPLQPTNLCASGRVDHPGRAEERGRRIAGLLRLIGRGLSSAEIAARLVVGGETVKTRVSRLPRELEVRDRAQAVVTAYGSGPAVPRRIS